MLGEILNSNFLENLISIILQVLMVIANIIMLPLNLLIAAIIPDVLGLLNLISDVFELATTYIGWGLSLLGIPAIILTMMLGYYTFVILLSLSTWLIKLGVRWWDTLT